MKTGTKSGLIRSSQLFFSALRKAQAAYKPELRLSEIGTVVSVGEGVATVSGFSTLLADEHLRFESGLSGVASTLSQREVGIMLLGDKDRIQAGQRVYRTGSQIRVPVGDGLLGRTINALGEPLDSSGAINATGHWPIERPAPPIMDRAPVMQPLQTGIKTIDAMIPIGRGQRELILGDRQTGKTAIAVDTIINQKNSGVICIYCAIGQRTSSVARVVKQLTDADMMAQTIIVVASGNDAPGLQFIAPYAAMTMAEFFMERGDDVLIVLDDLTRHARAYRETSLLMMRPPGREAYPGDIFYVHSRLLERAAHISDEKGGGSITALPIVETQAQNLSSYIPTNLISITDGQIYLSPELFNKAVLPAIDIGLSVSRVGGDAQPPAYRAVTSELKLSYAQFEELESFARFGAQLDPDSRSRLERGKRIREVLKQNERDGLPVSEQIPVLLAATAGMLDDVPLDKINQAERAIRDVIREDSDAVNAIFVPNKKLLAEQKNYLLGKIRGALTHAGLCKAGSEAKGAAQ